MYQRDAKHRAEVASPDHELMMDNEEDEGGPELSDVFCGTRPSPDEGRLPDMGALEIGGDSASGPKTKTWQAAFAARQAAKQQQKQQRVAGVRGYGSTELGARQAASKKSFNFRLPFAATGAYNMLQQAFVCVAGLWLLWSLAQRVLLSFLPGHAQVFGMAAAPSPSPGTGLGRQCSTYTYPQCEDAMKWYLQQGARDRCQAFEKVKAEGDSVMFPYTTSRDMCPAEGCCGCPGQCSRCPPLLPECSFWRFDGSWRVAFEDGSEAVYKFDPHGHCEAKLPKSLLPPVFKTYDNAYIPQEGSSSDLMSRWVTEAEAEKLCVETSGCQAISFDLTKRTDQGHYYAHLKSKPNMVTMPGKKWRTLIRQSGPPTFGGINVAGPLKPYVGGAKGAYALDLHLAAPSFFGLGAVDVITVAGGELQIERRLHQGQTIVKGTGVADRDLVP